MADTRRNKILLIGWDAADWKVINPLLDAGKMPALEGMIEGGVMGNLATIRPVLSPMLWTTIATGKRATKHGIHGFVEPAANGKDIQPITNLSRKSKAFWNIFNQSGLRGHVVGWWPSRPAEPINGVMVSNLFPEYLSHDPNDPWPTVATDVHPPRLLDELSDLRFHPGEFVDAQIRPFIPHADEVDQQNDKRAGVCMKIAAECTTIQSVATHLLQHEPWDYAAIYFDSIDHWSHGYMKYHPPRQQGIPEQDFRLYSNVVEAGYRYHDMMLATLLQLAGEDTTVILMSDHGFHPDHLRVFRLPEEPTAPVAEHRDYGILVMKGPGIRKDERIDGASLLDICPTLLTIAGLPVGRDMDGQPLIEAFESVPKVDLIDSWEDVSGDTGEHPKNMALTPLESQQAIQHLVDLGYIEKPDADTEKAVFKAINELDYNLASAHIDAGEIDEATKILADVLDKDPSLIRVGLRLLFCYHERGEIDKMRETLDKIKASRAKTQRQSATKFVDMFTELCKRDQTVAADDDIEMPEGQWLKPDDEPTTHDDSEHEIDVDLILEQHRAAVDLIFNEDESDEHRENAEREVMRLQRQLWDKANAAADEEEKEELAKLQNDGLRNPYSFDFLDGYLKMAEGETDNAIRYFRRAERLEPYRPAFPIQIGNAYLTLNRWNDAGRCFERALEIESENAAALMGLAEAYLGQKRYRDSADAALEAVSLVHLLPRAHELLGIALHRMGDAENAVRALETTVSLAPNTVNAYRRLRDIHRNRLKDPTKAEYYEQCRLKAIESQRNGESRESIVGKTASSETKRREWERVGDWIPNRPNCPPGLDRSKVITIVTGLPRSGTSMVMRMLGAGGIPLMTDGLREADDDNPHGYFELEKVKGLTTDSDWINDAKGGAVKVIAQLVSSLPRNRYRFIYVDRNMDEVVRSQAAMLERNAKSGADLDDEKLKDAFSVHIRELGRMLEAGSVPVLKLSHRDCIENPEDAARRINDFLGGGLDVSAMSKAVDSNLYRQRT